MEKIIIRNNFVSCTSSQFESLIEKELVDDFEMDYILREVYEEKVFGYEELMASFHDFVSKIVEENAEVENDEKFISCYEISKDFAVSLDSHITLYKLEEPIIIGGNAIVPWKYATGELYLGDTWWFDDREY